MKATIDIWQDMYYAQPCWVWEIVVGERFFILPTNSYNYTRKADAYRGARRVMRRLGLEEAK